MPHPPDFIADLSLRLLEDSFRFHGDNHDALRFPESADGSTPGDPWTSPAILRAAASAGFYRKTPDELAQSLQTLGWLRDLAGPLNFTYGLLADDHSRRAMVEVMAYRVLGPRHVKLFRNNSVYHQLAASLPSLVTRPHTADIALLDGVLNRYDLAPVGFPVEFDAHGLNVLYTFLLQQYRYARGGAAVEAAPGDWAIDGGGCWGDTALYLAHRVGPAGRVFCFEFSPDNLPVLERNLAMNPALGERIRLVRHALWSRSGEELSFSPGGPGTRVGPQTGGAAKVTTLSIDDLAGREQLPRLDFVKMDIEGAELDALKGAKQTLRRFRPKLAVTLYHRLQDFATIPRFLHDLDLGYRFYLDHFSINQEETVLFATTA